MKKLLLGLCLLFSVAVFAQPETHFVTTWKTDETGFLTETNNKSIKLPVSSGGGYLYDVDWDDDGDFDEFGITGSKTHEFDSPGTYTIRIRGSFPKIRFTGDNEKILSVDQWGSQVWTNLYAAFLACSNLDGPDFPISPPNLSAGPDVRLMFGDASAFNQDIGNWDVSQITDMEYMFYNASSFDQDLSDWDLSLTTSLFGMFSGATSFNSNVNFDVSNVINMERMFAGATSFNMDLWNWDVSNVMTMEAMFSGATSFNGAIAPWDVISVNNMSHMFENATSFNQFLQPWGAKVGNVMNFESMFEGATSFNQSLPDWDVSGATNMKNMFKGVTLSDENYFDLLHGFTQNSPQNNVKFHGGNSKFCEASAEHYILTNQNDWIIVDGGPNCPESQEHFVTKWKLTGSTAILIPTDFLSSYNYDVDWNNDGFFDSFGLSGNVYHSFSDIAEVGETVTIRIRGTFPAIDFLEIGNNWGGSPGFPEQVKQKIVSVEQWGDISWKSFVGAFIGCTNLAGQASDTPDLTNVSKMAFAFEDCSSFNQDIGDWDMQFITDANRMFSGATSFNQDISSWNMGSAVFLSAMFKDATSFNQPIGSWNVSNVVSFNSMFNGASTFNQNLSNWNLSSAEYMNSMFANAVSFNGNLSGWNLNNVSEIEEMFFNAESFNRDIGGWNVSNITNAEGLFSGASSFNKDIGAWDLSSAFSLNSMFENASDFDQNIGDWDVSFVVNQNPSSGFGNFLDNSGMSVNNYDKLLKGWNEIETGEGQLIGSSNVNFDAVGLDFCRGIDARQNLIESSNWVFNDGDILCDEADYFITRWQTDIDGDPSNTSITIPTTGGGYDYDVDWNNDGIFDEFGITGNVTHSYSTPGVKTIQINGDFPRIFFNDGVDKEKFIAVEQWGTQKWSSMSNAFNGCNNFNEIPTEAPDLSQAGNLSKMFANTTSFNQDIGNWNLINVNNISSMFLNAIAFNQDISSWNTSNVTVMSGVFSGASSFNMNIGSWNVGNVSSISSMFKDATLFNQDIGGWQFQSLTRAKGAFEGAVAFNQDLNNWNMSLVDDDGIDRMFKNATSFNGNISSWDVSMLDELNETFRGASAFNSDISGWNTGNVQFMERLFMDATSFNQDLGGWDVHSCEEMISMFENAIAFDQDIGDWNIITLFATDDMFLGAKLSTSNYDALLIGWSENEFDGGLDLHAGTSTYCEGEAARNFLENSENWNFEDAGLDCSDTDLDGVYDSEDNCPNDANADQADLDGDTIGDACDNDIDGDGNVNDFDCDPFDSSIFYGASCDDGNPNTSNDVYLPDCSCQGFLNDIDGDTVTDTEDNCPTDFNPDQSDIDSDNIGDVCDMDIDGDGFENDVDCDPEDANVYVGAPCDDGWTFTEFDMIQENCACIGQSVNPGDHFVTIWKTDNPGTSGSTSITIPVFPGETYNYDVDWNNDLQFDDLGVTGSITHDFGEEGIVVIRIRGQFPRIYFNGVSNATGDLGDHEKLKAIFQWGPNPWTSMNRAFAGCSNIEGNSIGTPNLNSVEDMSGMFEEASYDQPIDDWDISHVKNMSSLFAGATSFNEDISGWDVSGVTDMGGMFSGTEQFNQPIGGWDVQNVTSMVGMFSNATAFNQPIGQWDTHQVTSMAFMFSGATSFNQDLDSWATLNVLNMSGMFRNATSFNSEINGSGGNPGSWIVNQVTTMREMFRGATSFNRPIGNWQVNNVTNMRDMFRDAISFDQDISNWQIGNVSAMNNMFVDAELSVENYDALLIGWDAQIVQSGVSFHGGNSVYCDGELARLNLVNSNTWTIEDAGKNCANPATFGGYVWDDTNQNGIQDVSEAGIFNVTVRLIDVGLDGLAGTADDVVVQVVQSDLNGDYLFNHVDANEYYIEFDPTTLPAGYEFSLSGQGIDPNLDSDVDFNGITETFFAYNGFEDDLSFDAGAIDSQFSAITQHFVTTWKTDNAGVSSATSIQIPTFPGEVYLYDVDWDNDGLFDEFGLTTDATHNFGASGTYTIQIRGDFPRIYFNNQGDKHKLLSVDSWGIDKWTSMEDAFHGCSNLAGDALYPPDLDLVTDMSRMFKNASSYNADMQYWDTEGVLEMDEMFSGASLFNTPIGQWDVIFAENLSGMFENATAFNQDLNSWIPFYAEDMSRMFAGASSFNQSIGGWYVANVTDFSQMFKNATSFNQDIGLWSIIEAQNLSEMFAGASNFDQDLGAWDISKATDLTNMFMGVSLSISNYDALLVGWNTRTVQQDVNFDGGNSEYCSQEAADARQNLIDIYNWTVSDQGLNSNCIVFCHSKDKAILEAIADAFPSVSFGNWDFSDPTIAPDETWQGVGMTPDGCKVDSLNFNGVGLTGLLPDTMGYLSALRYLQLGDNNISGTLPLTFENLNSLTYLNMHNNDMNGEGIPVVLENIPTLEKIFLGVNDMGGTIPSWLGEMPNLNQLDLVNNVLIGSIPTSFGEGTTSLVTFSVHNNLLSGPLPKELGLLPSIGSLRFSNNNLTGCYPTTFYNLCDILVYAEGSGLDNENFSSFCSDDIGACPPTCPTDFNEDGVTDGQDFSIFLGNYGINCVANPCQTDLTFDGVTDGVDFSIFLGNYGLDCMPTE